MAFCNKCGASLPDGIKYCTSCGQPVEASTETNPNNTVYNAEPQPAAPQYTAPQYTAPQQSPFAQQSVGGQDMTQKTNGIAIAGFVVSIVSFVCCCCGIMGIAGLVLSIVGLMQVNKNNQKGKGLAIAGIVISGIVVAMWLISLILSMTGTVDTNYAEWMEEIIEESNY